MPGGGLEPPQCYHRRILSFPDFVDRSDTYRRTSLTIHVVFVSISCGFPAVSRAFCEQEEMHR